MLSRKQSVNFQNKENKRNKDKSRKRVDDWGIGFEVILFDVFSL